MERLRSVDTGNYYPQQSDGRIDAIEEGMTESGWVARQLDRPVVKDFNNIYARTGVTRLREQSGCLHRPGLTRSVTSGAEAGPPVAPIHQGG